MSQVTRKKINFVTNKNWLRDMAYGDIVYAWLLLHSNFSKDENHNYIEKSKVNISQIAREIGRNRKTVTSRFNKLLVAGIPEELLPDPNDDEIIKQAKKEQIKQLRNNLLIWDDGKKYYILPCFKEFQYLDSETVLNLFRLSSQKQSREELIKTYAWLMQEWHKRHREISYKEVLQVFGHSVGNEKSYNRVKDIFTTLQGAGLIEFRTNLLARNSQGYFNKTLEVIQVNDKASQKWLDKQKKEE